MANPTGKGGFTPGKSGNESGRPPESEEVKKAKEDIKKLLPSAVLKLQDWINSNDPDKEEWAMEKILAYGIGKPAQSMEITGKDGGDIHIYINRKPKTDAN